MVAILPCHPQYLCEDRLEEGTYVSLSWVAHLDPRPQPSWARGRLEHARRLYDHSACHAALVPGAWHRRVQRFCGPGLTALDWPVHQSLLFPTLGYSTRVASRSCLGPVCVADTHYRGV